MTYTWRRGDEWYLHSGKPKTLISYLRKRLTWPIIIRMDHMQHGTGIMFIWRDEL